MTIDHLSITNPNRRETINRFRIPSGFPARPARLFQRRVRLRPRDIPGGRREQREQG